MKTSDIAGSFEVDGPFIAFGNRGVSCPQLNLIPDGMQLNRFQPLPQHGPGDNWGSDFEDHRGVQPLWRLVHSYVQSRKHGDTFFFGTLAEALRLKLVNIFEGVTAERKCS